jgi:hypothetical protein
MPLWGNTDTANNKPHFSQFREVVPVTTVTTANATTGGNTIITTSNSNFSSLAVGQYLYSVDANNAISRSAKDLSILDGNEQSFWRSNNVIRVIDSGNNRIQFANPVMGTLATGSVVAVGTGLAYHAGTTASVGANDVILVTSTRMANTQGVTAPLAGGGSTVANTKLGSVNQGWNLIIRKINSDGTIRFLKETLVALASPVASNTQSANTSANAIYGGV